MQTAKQLSVSLVNKPGRLAAMMTALGKEKVDFLALSVMDSGERGTASASCPTTWIRPWKSFRA